MRNGVIPPERFQDPLARTLHPKLSRDPERTPMHWSAGAGRGLHDGRAVAADRAPTRRSATSRRSARTARSLLWLYKDLLALRRATPGARARRYRALDAKPGVLAYERHERASRALVALNFGEAESLARASERARDRRAAHARRRDAPAERRRARARAERGRGARRRWWLSRKGGARSAASSDRARCSGGREHGAVALRARRVGAGRRATGRRRPSCPRVPSSGARSCAPASALAPNPEPKPAERTDYFALCLAAHFATAATYVPTDVDTKIRRALWREAVGTDELPRMRALALGLARWDMRAVSARIVARRRRRARSRATTASGSRCCAAGSSRRSRRATSEARASSRRRSTPSSRARRARSPPLARAPGASSICCGSRRSSRTTPAT